ncbi:MAG: SUMF1/EgtB/PvdO family nonheme iron enzyme [Gammaproteobacteria bacterium]|nr:SUMF1/EgtB/PvdO family nonheme iron enzyme [Gammaproteobacteria bacterium]
MKLRLALALCAAVLMAPLHAQTTPAQIQVDLLENQIDAAMKAKDHTRAADLFDQYDRLGVAMPPPLQLLRAVAYFRLKRYWNAEKELQAYLQRVERNSPDYRLALDMLRQVTPLASPETFSDCDVCPEMVVVPAGSFMMGSPSSEEGRYDDEGPVHQVNIARPFAAGVREVTFAEWDACVADGGCYGYSPGDEGWGRGKRPVINVIWEEARGYVRWLSAETGKEYRLLSESEWEYAARAGTTTPFHYGSTISTGQANYNGNYTYGSGAKGEYRGRTVPVGSFPANQFGLHDVHGNVWEWTQDCWNHNYQGAPTDGSAWESGDCSRRVLRGGSWNLDPRDLRSADRDRFATGVRSIGVGGFRVARTLTP